MEGRREQGPDPGLPAAEPGPQGLILGAAGLAAAASRWALSGVDGRGQGYDIWYYVLQVEGLRQGVDRFGDDSLVFPLLRALTAWLGDPVLACEGLALGAAVVVAVGMARAGGHLGGPVGAAVAGAVAVASTGHLALSMEFLKNAVGAALFVGAVEALVAPRPAWGRAVAAAGVALFTHKLVAVLTLLALGLAVAARWGRAAAGVLGVGAAAGGGAMLLGVVARVDLLRRVPLGGPLDRLDGLGRLPWSEALEMGLVSVLPLGLGAALIVGRVPHRPALLLGGLAVVCAAPGLALDFDGLAWRLLCMGFVPLGLALAALRPARPLAWGLVVGLLTLVPVHVQAHRARSPDYAAWDPVLPRLRQLVPPDGELVAHRGLCGYLWAVGGRRCGNFDPTSTEGVWRVVFGFSEAALADAGPSDALRPGYRLMAEASWRAFRQHSDHPWVRDPRNPWRPAPPWARRLRAAPHE